MRRSWILVSLLAALLLASGAASAPPKRSIAITSVTAKGDVLVVGVRISGWKMYPGLVGKRANRRDGGHWHILVNGRYNNHVVSRTTGRTATLPAGTYEVRVELANNDHSPLKPRVRSAAVKATIAATGATPPPPSGDYGDYPGGG